MTVTSRGVGLLAVAAVSLLSGFWFGYAELALLGAAAAVAVGYAMGHAAWRPRLDVRRTAEPDRVGRGEPATVTLTVRNRDRLRSASLIAEDRCGDRRVAVPLLRLRPGRDTTVSYPVPTTRRGVVPIGPLLVTGRDALGLVTLARSHGDAVRVWVHPRIHPLSAVPAGVTRSLDGRSDRVPHGSITFDSLREYVVGDELRRVHWRTSARVGELMVREQLDTSLPRLVVLLDDRAAAHPEVVDGLAETFESACEAAASVVAAARREELPVLMFLVSDGVAGADPAACDRTGAGRSGGRDGGAGPPGGPGQPDDDDGGDYLDQLAAVTLHPGPRGLPEDPLRQVTARLRQERVGDTLVFLTGPGGRGDLGYLGTLRGAYPVLVVGIFGSGDGTASGAPGMVVIDAADGAGFAAEWDGVGRW